jgi:hypothetical protein
VNASTVRLAPLGALAVAVGAAFAAPPTASFLTPSQYGPQVGQTLTLHFDAGLAKDARPTPWPSDEIEWLFVRGGGEQENRAEARPQRANDNFISLNVAHPSATVIGTNRTAILHDVSGAELQKFCEQNLGALPEAVNKLAADRKLRVRHFSSAKLMVRAPSAAQPEPSATANRRTGQKVEIRPLCDPTSLRVGSDLPVFVYVDGVKQPGAKVQATSLATGQTQNFLADAEGSGHFRIADAGVWRVEFHQAQPLTEDPSADWVVYSGTMSFEVKGGGK